MASRADRAGRIRDAERARAQEAAKAIIAQGRQVARDALERGFPAGGGVMESEPMNRYIHPILPPGGCPLPQQGDVRDDLGRILESLACQNQLLIDILGAINALTAATLSAQSRQ